MTKAERLEKEKELFLKMKETEENLHNMGIKYIAGIDEVGRGPLAGPVYAAVVVLPRDFDVLGINDSKKLSKKKREELDKEIREKALAYGIGISTNKEIDELNILNATKLAMRRAIDAANDKLNDKPGAKIEMLLIDAVKLEDVDIKQESIIKGDEKIISIAAASIVAKVARDKYMEDMDELYPGYDFSSNKGYGTKAHYSGLSDFGACPIHRLTFLKKFFSGQENGYQIGTKAEDKRVANKVYAVRKGKTTGIFDTWDECKASVDGVSGAEYKSFKTIEDAREYLGLEVKEKVDDGIAKAYVDGSYDIADGRYSCGVVIINNGEVVKMNDVFDDEENSSLRNVAGEIMGSQKAIEYCLKNNIKKVYIYHDYAGIGKWGNDEWKANLDMTREYKRIVKEAREKIEITFIKVKAHAGNKYNEVADELAKKAFEK